MGRYKQNVYAEKNQIMLFLLEKSKAKKLPPFPKRTHNFCQKTYFFTALEVCGWDQFHEAICIHAPTHAQPSLPIIPDPNPISAGLHYTAAVDILKLSTKNV